VFSTPGAGGVGDDGVEDGPVKADRVLPSHKVMDNLQHWAVK